MPGKRKNLMQHPRSASLIHDYHGTERLTQEEARSLLAAGDLSRVWGGLIWFVQWLLGKFLHKYPFAEKSDQNDLTNEGMLALGETLAHLSKKPERIPKGLFAYISTALERRFLDFCDSDRLVPIPARTQRDQIRKRKPPLPHLEFDELFEPSVSSGGPDIYESAELSDLFEYCRDPLDQQILAARFDNGAGPLTYAEVASKVGVSPATVGKRFRRIKERYIAASPRPRRRKPKKFDAFSAACRLGTKGTARKTVSLAPVTPAQIPQQDLSVKA